MEHTMSDRLSAEIIAFPRRPARPADIPPAPLAADPAERLRKALAALDAAVTAQRTAVADWRMALAGLRGSMGELGQSMRGYHDSLGRLGEKVETLGASARGLAARAELAERGAHDPAQ